MSPDRPPGSDGTLANCTPMGTSWTLDIIDAPFWGVNCIASRINWCWSGMSSTRRPINCTPSGISCMRSGISSSRTPTDCTLSGMSSTRRPINCTPSGISCMWSGISSSRTPTDCTLSGISSTRTAIHFTRSAINWSRREMRCFGGRLLWSIACVVRERSGLGDVSEPMPATQPPSTLRSQAFAWTLPDRARGVTRCDRASRVRSARERSSGLGDQKEASVRRLLVAVVWAWLPVAASGPTSPRWSRVSIRASAATSFARSP